MPIDCNGLFCLLIFEEKCHNYASGRKSASNSDSFWVRRLFNVCIRENEQVEAVTVNCDRYRAMFNEFLFTKIEE